MTPAMLPRFAVVRAGVETGTRPLRLSMPGGLCPCSEFATDRLFLHGAILQQETNAGPTGPYGRRFNRSRPTKDPRGARGVQRGDAEGIKDLQEEFVRQRAGKLKRGLM